MARTIRKSVGLFLILLAAAILFMGNTPGFALTVMGEIIFFGFIFGGLGLLVIG